MIASAILPDPILEHKFSELRDFRFDYAWLDVKLAVEIEGGIYKKSRHTSPEGYSRDCDKYNLAQIEGWIVLRFTEINITDAKDLTEYVYHKRRSDNGHEPAF